MVRIDSCKLYICFTLNVLVTGLLGFYAVSAEAAEEPPDDALLACHLLAKLDSGFDPTIPSAGGDQGDYEFSVDQCLVDKGFEAQFGTGGVPETPTTTTKDAWLLGSFQCIFRLGPSEQGESVGVEVLEFSRNMDGSYLRKRTLSMYTCRNGSIVNKQDFTPSKDFGLLGEDTIVYSDKTVINEISKDGDSIALRIKGAGEADWLSVRKCSRTIVQNPC